MSTDQPSAEEPDPAQRVVWETVGQQRALIVALREREEQLATWYHGALLILNDGNNPDALALAAHGIRELMEKIPQILDVKIKAQNESTNQKAAELAEAFGRGQGKSECWDGHSWQGPIDKALGVLLGKVGEFVGWFVAHQPRRREEAANTLRALDGSGRVLPEPIEELNVRQWFEMRDYFVGVAHHRPSANEDEFVNWLDALERFLLDRLKPRTFDDLGLIDALIEEGEKGDRPEIVQRAVVEIRKRAANYEHFFDRLTSPDWIAPLRREGFFQSPPAAVRKGDLISFPPWAESQYLARMAPKAPPLVLDVMLGMAETDNERVCMDLAEAAVSLPPGMASQWVRKEIERLRGEVYFYLLLPQKLAALIPHLAGGGEVDAALDLAWILFEVLPGIPKSLDNDEQEEAVFQFTPEPRGRFDQWHYVQLLEDCVPNLVKFAGERALWLICDLLDSALRFREREPPEDDSYLWWPAIERYQQNRRFGVTDALVTAVRDAAEQLAARYPGTVPALAQGLEQRAWYVFRRVALHLLRLFPNDTSDLIAQRLTNRTHFDNPHLRHEYALLSKEQFGRLPPNDQEVILSWIEDGPDLGSYAQWVQESEGRSVTDDELQREKRRWQHIRLTPVKEAIPDSWRGRYDELVQEFGEAKHPDFVAYTTSWHGPTSPKAAADLRGMDVADTVAYLEEWQPPDDYHADSREGLALQLTEATSTEPERFARDAALFEGVHTNYLHGLFRGFEKATERGRRFSWDPVLDLSRAVVIQPRTPIAEGERRERDDWSEATRSAIASLVDRSLGKRTIPIELREKIWAVVEPLTDDPDPTPEREAPDHGGRDYDPYSLSINCVRGTALHAVVRYGLWIRQDLDQDPDAWERIARGFDEMPEVRGVLDRHLDPQHDPSRAVRAVYGRWFPWLHLLDPDWTTSCVNRIFPTDTAHRDLYDAAWQTYVCWCPPYKNVAALLTDHYRQAVERLGPSRPEHRHQPDPEERLTEHLMILYWVGELALHEPDGMLDRFYAVAPLELRAHAVDYAGRSLSSMEGELEPGRVDAMKVLWQYRLDWVQGAAAPPDAPAELVGFGWWFTSGKLDDEWALAQLQEVLRIAGKVEPDHMVVQRLAEMVGEHPLRVVRCLAGIVDADQEGWSIHGWMQDSRNILSAAVNSDNMEARDAAIDLIHRLGARGHWNFRDLLPNEASEQ